jgi:hypothetical protein
MACYGDSFFCVAREGRFEDYIEDFGGETACKMAMRKRNIVIGE